MQVFNASQFQSRARLLPIRQAKLVRKTQVKASIGNLSTTNMSDMLKYFNRIVSTPEADKRLYENNTYTFDMDARLTLPEVRRIFEEVFQVNVVSIGGYRKKVPDKFGIGFHNIWLKRVYITVEEGQFPFAKLSKDDSIEMTATDGIDD